MNAIDKLNKLEANENWKEAFDYLIDTWAYDKSYYFSLRFLFFCWHIAAFNHHMKFKNIVKVNDVDKSKDTIFDGISCNKLYEYIGLIAKNISINHSNQNDYVKNVLFSHMIQIVPYLFDSTFYDKHTKMILTNAYKKMPDNPIIKKQYLGSISDPRYSQLKFSEEEKNYIRNYFPSNGFFDGYFKWWYLDEI